MEKKLSLSEKVRKELDQQVETLEVLEDKEKEIKDTKDQLYQSKEAAIREYHDSNTLLEELGTSYTDGFDDAIRQAKRAYPDLDFSQLSIDTQPQATVQPVASKSMRICLPTTQPLVTGIQFLSRTRPSPSMVTSVSLQSLKTLLKSPPLNSKMLSFYFFGL